MKRARLLRAPVGFAVLIVLGITAILSCSGRDSTGPTRLHGTEDEQRYQMLRGIMVSMLTECCMALNQSIEAVDQIDTTMIPGLEWPLEFPAVKPTRVSESNGTFRLSYSYSSGTASISSNLQVSRTDIEVRYRLSYMFRESSRIVMPENWTASLDVGIVGPIADQTSVRVSFNVTRRVTGLCPNSPCELYQFSVTGMMEPGHELAVESFLPGGVIIGQLDETATSEYFDSDIQVRWNVTGSLMADALLEMQTTSGSFFVRDTIPLCP